MPLKANSQMIRKLAKSGFDVYKMTSRKQRSCKAKELVEPKATISLVLPVEVVSDQNTRTHWAVKMRIKNRQREALAGFFFAFGAVVSGVKRDGQKWEVVLRRLGSKSPMDSDNLGRCFKHVRDWIAEYMGFPNDKEGEELSFRYEQAPAGKPGVEIVFHRLPAKG